MNPHSIRKVDAWIGKPVCLLLTVMRKLFGPLSARDNARPVRRILLIKMIEQGATVLAYQAISRACQMVGPGNVYFWVFEENRFILDLLKLVPPENVIVVRGKTPLMKALDLLRTAWRCRRLKIDATVDMEFFSRASAILAFLTGARRRVGMHRYNSEGPYRGDLLTHRIQYNPYVHTAVAYFLMVEAINLDPRQRPLPKVELPSIDFFRAPAFVPDPQETQKVQGILDRLAGRSVPRPMVLLNPNASDLLPLRKWPADNFIALGRKILANHPEVTLVLTGAPNEAEPARALAEQMGTGVLTLAGETSLRELLVTYTMADVLVTNDSGPGHFSSMTEISSIVLFGPETPMLFGPLGRNTRVIRRDLACSPCVNPFNHRFSPCNDPVCMTGIAVDEVYEQVRLALTRKSQPQALTVLDTTRLTTATSAAGVEVSTNEIGMRA